MVLISALLCQFSSDSDDLVIPDNTPPGGGDGESEFGSGGRGDEETEGGEDDNTSSVFPGSRRVCFILRVVSLFYKR